MTRSLLSLSLLSAILASGVADARSPDQVAHSPVPPLKAPALRPTGEATLAEKLPADATSQETFADEKRLLWESADMLAARDAVLRFSKISAQTTEAEAERFLDRVSQLSYEDMKDWLKRFQARQATATRARDASDRARRQRVERSILRNQTARRAAVNAALQRSQAFLLSEPYQPSEPTRVASLPFSNHQVNPAFGPPRFDPFDPVFDPASPPKYIRQLGAAATLPGDLAPGDPGNFISGEEGLSFGDE
ncbi:MAG: hypothetical protein AAGA92_13300 [Planctomycetota bacterium]